MPPQDDAPQPRFPLALRGYDRNAVDAFLETNDEGVAPQAKRQLDRFGEKVEVILAAAEETASELRAEAERESRRSMAAANAKAEEILVDGDRRAQRLIAEGTRRRRLIEKEISTLVSRRDELTAQLSALAQELQLSAVQTSRIQAIEEEEDLPAEEGEPAPDELEEVDDLDELDLDELEDDDGLEEEEDDEFSEDEFAANGSEREIDSEFDTILRGPRFQPRDPAPLDHE